MKIWLKGGLIGVGVGVILLIITFIDNIGRYLSLDYFTEFLILSLFALVAHFIVGSLVGLIIQGVIETKLKSWIKGALIGFFVFLIFLFLGYFVPIIPFINILFGISKMNNFSLAILFTIIGAIIGLIIQKVKK